VNGKNSSGSNINNKNSSSSSISNSGSQVRDAGALARWLDDSSSRIDLFHAALAARARLVMEHGLGRSHLKHAG
jgi:hypothetical protein